MLLQPFTQEYDHHLRIEIISESHTKLESLLCGYNTVRPTLTLSHWISSHIIGCWASIEDSTWFIDFPVSWSVSHCSVFTGYAQTANLG